MENLIELTVKELMTIDGGGKDRGFWGDLAYGVSYAAHQFVYWAEQVKQNEAQLFYK